MFSGATVGPIDYSQFGGYLIAATQLGTVVSGGLKPVVATAQSADQLSVATYNVENLAPTDPADKYARLAQGVVTNLASPDIIAVEEVQDNNGRRRRRHRRGRPDAHPADRPRSARRAVRSTSGVRSTR